MHRAALSIGHADLAAEQLTDDTGDCPTTEDSKGMAAVGRDNLVFLGYSRLQTNWDGFLKERKMLDENEQSDRSRLYRTHLANGKMIDTTDELALVQHVGDCSMRRIVTMSVYILRRLSLVTSTVKGRGVGVISSKWVFMKLDREWCRSVFRYLLDKLCWIGRGLQWAGKRLLSSVRTYADKNFKLLTA
jgi:hypothetical protein